MFPQATMIERVRVLCRDDTRLDAAMMYGSFTSGEGDAFSDIEFLLFFEGEAFSTLDRRAWLEQIAPVELLFVNEFGVATAIFGNLVRGEFHFHSVSEMTVAQAWPGVISFSSLDSTLIVDKSGRLTPYLQPLIGPPPLRVVPEKLHVVANCFTNWWLFGFNVLRRGEYARAVDILGAVQRNLLWMARAVQGRTEHWHIPSRRLEQDLSPDAYTRFKACTAPLEESALWGAYRAAWAWGRELIGARCAFSTELRCRSGCWPPLTAHLTGYRLRMFRTPANTQPLGGEQNSVTTQRSPVSPSPSSPPHAVERGNSRKP